MSKERSKEEDLQLKAKAERVRAMITPESVWKKADDDALELFGLGHLTYSSWTSRLAEAMIHYIFDGSHHGISVTEGGGYYYTEFAELFGYDENVVELLTYVLASQKGEKDDLFEYGSSPRGFWPTEEGKRFYGLFLETIKRRSSK